MKTTQVYQVCLINFILFFIFGCSSNLEEKRNFIPNGGLTMPEVYKNEMYGRNGNSDQSLDLGDEIKIVNNSGNNNRTDNSIFDFDEEPPFLIEAKDDKKVTIKKVIKIRPISDNTTDLFGYTREAHTELKIRFPRLPNPTLVMYVFPHLTKENAPIPGYVTTFPMYEVDQYALPGEVR